MTDPNPRPRTLHIRLSDDEYTAIEAIAKTEHLRTSTWVRKLCLDAAARTKTDTDAPV